MRKLLDKPAFLEFGEHIEEGAAVILLEVQGAGELLEGHRFRSKLQKTQNVIRAELGFGGHQQVPFSERGERTKLILVIFLKIAVTFLVFPGFHR